MDGDRGVKEFTLGDTSGSDPGHHGIQSHVKG